MVTGYRGAAFWRKVRGVSGILSAHSHVIEFWILIPSERLRRTGSWNLNRYTRYTLRRPGVKLDSVRKRTPGIGIMEKVTVIYELILNTEPRLAAQMGTGVHSMTFAH